MLQIPLRMAFAAPQRPRRAALPEVLEGCASISFVSGGALGSASASPVTHQSFSSTLFSPHVSVGFARFLSFYSWFLVSEPRGCNRCLMWSQLR